MADLAFIGMGIMGAPMAGHLLAAGHRVAVWNRTREKTEPLAAKGARVAESAEGVARGAEAVFVCVGDTLDVEDVLFRERGAVFGLSAGALVVNCSTIAPEAEIGFAARVVNKGGAYLDAPVTGGQKGAIEGTLTFIVGGSSADLERARPYLMAMGKKIIHAGAIGAGQKLKMVNQIVCALHIVALGEGFAAARALQLDLSQARDLLTSGAARSWALEVYGEKVLDGDFAPGFPLKWQTKDMRIATEALGEMGLDLPGVRMAYERLKEAVRRGFGDEGSHAIYKLYL